MSLKLYPLLQLHPKKEKAVVNRHPWIFSGAVHKTEAMEGDIAEVKNHDGKVLGYGFYSSQSQIACRMFDWGAIPAAFDTVEYWKGKIEKAQTIRKYFLAQQDTNAYRLIHAEGDFLPGIIADVYNDTVVLQVVTVGTDKIKELIFQALRDLGFNNQYLKIKNSRVPSNSDKHLVSPAFKSSICITEHGITFLIDIVNGQKTGFFIDQRENRKLLQTLAKGKIVLNAFGYTGGFSVYALSGGAKEVYTLDISKEALEGADQNAKINHYDKNHHLICEDCFEYLTNMSSNYFDMIVLDPPAFAKHSRAVENAAKGYKQINLKAIQKIKPGGLIFTFSCSQHISKDLFQKIVFAAASDAKRNVRILQQLHQPADHPINIFHPEGEYLKGLLLWVE